MKLHSPQFERALKRGVKDRIKQSPELKREYRNAKKAVRRRFAQFWLFRPFWSLALAVFTGLYFKATGHPASGLAVINLGTLFTVLFSASLLLHYVFAANDLPALSLLPVPDAVIFRWEMEKFFKRHALFSLSDQIAAYAVLAFCLNFSFWQWPFAILLAFLSWGMALGLTGLCATRLSWLPYQKILPVIILSAFGFFMTQKFIGPALFGFIDRVAPTLNLVLPTGWVPSLFLLCLPHPDWWMAVYLVPVLMIIFTIRKSLAILRSHRKFRERTIPNIGQISPAVLANANAVRKTAESQSPGPTAIEEVIQSRQFLLQEEPRGWLEQWLWKWFSPRERALGEFAFPNGIQITRPWLMVLRNFLIMALVGFGLGLVDPVITNWVFGIGFFITLCQCLAQILSNGMAFRPMFNGGVLIPLYAAYPVVFRDLSQTLFKMSVIQLPFFLVYTVASGILIAHLAALDWFSGLIMGFKAGLMIFSGRYIVTVLAFSSRTNDTSRFRLRTITLIVLIIGGGLLFLTLCGLSLFITNVPVAWLLCAGAILDAYAMFRIYGWFYHANRFDLMSLPRR